MGIQRMNSQVSGSGQQSHVRHPSARKSSWFGLTLDEVENRLGDLGKPLGHMNLDELLKNVLTAEARYSSGMDPSSNSPAASLQRQASLSLVRAFPGKTVNEVWRDIQQGYKMRNLESMSGQERGKTLGETTLEDFLVKAGMCVADASLETAMSLDSALISHNFPTQIRLSPSASIDTLSDTPMQGRRRDSTDLENTIERRLRRKIKNRESAARSRARKQAYHDELVGKVSRLEEENLKLTKEKVSNLCVVLSILPCECYDALSEYILIPLSL
ncbi:ABSCISIC ACID-INSENSITIVE 5-like protein 2 isoform X1 [Primulina huaijiensis]|uniref:ABSCISIC ACID-INSENSITIVE 5-like protein 2 isoform X1 n=1 Tax=Primulina huaijiensis TaxID=1492673 RepID=UPI003CC70178